MASRRILRSNDTFQLTRFTQRTAEERQRAWYVHRFTGIGGSDMATILGLNPYKSSYQLYLEKTMRVLPEDISDKWAVVKGNALEAELRRRFRSLHPEYQVTDGTWRSFQSKKHPYLLASLDGWLWDEATRSWGILEIKTANWRRGAADWHDENGALKIPDYYMAQVTHYMLVTGFTWGYVYADIGESEPVEVKFTRDEQDIITVDVQAHAFWHCVEHHITPDLLTVDDVKRAYPKDNGEVEATESSEFTQASLDYEQYGKQEAAARKAKEEAKQRLILLIGERKGLANGEWQATYATTHYKERLIPASDVRVLRVKSLTKKTDNQTKE